MFPPSNHAPVSPSRLSRIIDCPGSFRLTQKYDQNKSSSYAAEGTRLHLATELTLRGHMKEPGWPLCNLTVRADIVSPPLDKEQVSAVEDCLEYLQTIYRTVDEPILFLEERVDLKQFDSILYECSGTCDIVIEGKTELHVIDWKFGKGIQVFAQNNDQCYAYAAGAVGSPKVLDKYKLIHVHVVQPRLEHYDVVELTPEELNFWLDSRVIPGVGRAYEKHAPFNPSTTSCRWCPAKIGCRARFNAVNQTAADVFAAHAKLPDMAVSDEELSSLLVKGEELDRYIKDIRTYVQRTLESGEQFPGFKMVHGRSLRQWVSPAEAEE